MTKKMSEDERLTKEAIKTANKLLKTDQKLLDANKPKYDKLEKEYTKIYHEMWKYKGTSQYKKMQDRLKDLEFEMNKIKAKNSEISREMERIEDTVDHL
jgi:hypothetical protein